MLARKRRKYLRIILLTSYINAMATAGISASSSDEFNPANSISRLVVEKLRGVNTVIKEIDDDSQSDSEETPSAHLISLPKQLSDFSVEAEYFRLSFDVLNVLEKYGTHIGLSDTTALTGPIPWSGKLRFLPHVYHHISRSTPVQLTMPAFPCKSVSPIHRVQDICLANTVSAESREQSPGPSSRPRRRTCPSPIEHNGRECEGGL